MGLLTNILLAPFLAPIYGTKWTLDKVDRVVRAEYVRREAELMQRFREVREWREKLGMPTSGGPVRVAEGDETD